VQEGWVGVGAERVTALAEAAAEGQGGGMVLEIGDYGVGG
jgi:hypothetical protein